MAPPRHRRPSTRLTVTGLGVFFAAVGAIFAAAGPVPEWFPGHGRSPSAGAQAARSPEPPAIVVSVPETGNGGDPSCLRRLNLLPGGITDLAGPPKPPQAGHGPDETAGWFAAHHAVEVVDTVVFSVEGRLPRAVLLRDLRAVVDDWRPATGALASIAGGGCGSHVDQQYFTLTLGAASEPIALVAGQDTKGFPYSSSAGDLNDFVVFADGITGDVTWHLELRWTFEGKPSTTRIPAGDGSFRSATAPHYCAESATALAAARSRCPY
jgi:hypothetical protein